jgi:hypothetical protein
MEPVQVDTDRPIGCLRLRFDCGDCVLEFRAPEFWIVWPRRTRHATVNPVVELAGFRHGKLGVNEPVVVVDELQRRLTILCFPCPVRTVLSGVAMNVSSANVELFLN